MSTFTDFHAVLTSLGVNQGSVYIFKRYVTTDKYVLSGTLIANSIPPGQRNTSLFGWSLAFSKKKVRLISGSACVKSFF